MKYDAIVGLLGELAMLPSFKMTGKGGLIDIVEADGFQYNASNLPIEEALFQSLVYLSIQIELRTQRLLMNQRGHAIEE